jgi:hypothetical protein
MVGVFEVSAPGAGVISSAALLAYGNPMGALAMAILSFGVYVYVELSA